MIRVKCLYTVYMYTKSQFQFKTASIHSSYDGFSKLQYKILKKRKLSRANLSTLLKTDFIQNFKKHT